MYVVKNISLFRIFFFFTVKGEEPLCYMEPDFMILLLLIIIRRVYYQVFWKYVLRDYEIWILCQWLLLKFHLRMHCELWSFYIWEPRPLKHIKWNFPRLKALKLSYLSYLVIKVGQVDLIQNVFYWLKWNLSQTSTVSWNGNLELSLDPIEHSERKMGQFTWLKLSQLVVIVCQLKIG